MLWKKLILTTLIFTSQVEGSLAQEIQCKSVLSNHLTQNLPEYRFEKYQESFLKEGHHKVHPEFAELAQAIFSTNKNKFKKLIPKKSFPESDRMNSKPEHDLFENGFRSKLTDTGREYPRLYHKTSADLANQLKSNEAQLKLTHGTFNRAAICAGDAHFKPFKSSNAVTRRSFSSAELQIHPKARTLNISRTAFGDKGASEYSYYNSYIWFTDVFVPKLIAGKYEKDFPELTAIVKKQGDFYFTEEAFGLLLNIDILMISKPYEWRMQHEYWILNPEVITGYIVN